MKLFKGKPSKLTKIFEAGDSWEKDIYVKPPSANSYAVLMSKFENLHKEGNSLKELFETLMNIQISWIICCSCDDSGIPCFDDSDRDDISENLDKAYIDELFYEALDLSGLKTMGNNIQGMFNKLSVNDNDSNNDDNQETETEKK